MPFLLLLLIWLSGCANHVPKDNLDKKALVFLNQSVFDLNEKQKHLNVKLIEDAHSGFSIAAKKNGKVCYINTNSKLVTNELSRLITSKKVSDFIIYHEFFHCLEQEQQYIEFVENCEGVEASELKADLFASFFADEQTRKRILKLRLNHISIKNEERVKKSLAEGFLGYSLSDIDELVNQVNKKVKNICK